MVVETITKDECPILISHHSKWLLPSKSISHLFIKILPIQNYGRADKTEQRYVIKHYHRWEKSALEIHKILKATYGDAILSRATIYQRYNAFKQGRETATLKGGPGTPC